MHANLQNSRWMLKLKSKSNERVEVDKSTCWSWSFLSHDSKELDSYRMTNSQLEKSESWFCESYFSLILFIYNQQVSFMWMHLVLERAFSFGVKTKERVRVIHAYHPLLQCHQHRPSRPVVKLSTWEKLFTWKDYTMFWKGTHIRLVNVTLSSLLHDTKT